MKTHHLKSGATSKGVALVIVLAIVVLLTGLIVAFFSSVTSDAKTARTQIALAESDALSDSVVQIAISQIRSATQSTSPDGVANLTWASQPGAIRTFQNSSGGPTHRIYKLYSAGAMTVSGAAASNWNPASDLPTGEFRQIDANGKSRDYSALWADLNSPVRDSAGNEIFPIANPRADGSLNLADKVDGFSVNQGVVAGTSATRLPMPVKWLYILKSGVPTAMNGAGNALTAASTLQLNQLHDGYKDAITARVAFWTDDESSKVNLNTAAGGKYWDIPRAWTDEEQKFGQFQPALREFQRYPGHPASTRLQTVFPNASDDEIYAIVPRVSGGGSDGGTKIATAPVNPDKDRLYANVDELLYEPGSRSLNNSAITPEAIEMRRFFLTANSRAPETTLFATPRVAIWPIFRDHLTTAGRTTAFDNLIAFCSTINGEPYFFQRENADSTTNDIVIPRNQELLAYLGRLSGQAFPGFGGNFAAKYPADKNQILHEIFDYVRSVNLYDDILSASGGIPFTDGRASSSAGNPGHGQVTPTYDSTNNTLGFGRFYSVSEASIHFITTGQSDDPSTAAVDESAGSNDPTTNKTLGATPLAAPGSPTGEERSIQAALVLELFSPMQGWSGLVPDFRIRITGLNGFAVNSQNLGFPNDDTMVIDQVPGNANQGRSWGGSSGFRFPLNGRRIPARGIMPADADWTATNSYPFVGAPIRITPVGGKMDFSGGTIDVEIHAGGSGTLGPTTLVQTLKVKFPSAPGLPVPTILGPGNPSMPIPPGTTKEQWWTFSGRVKNVHLAPGGYNTGYIAPNAGAWMLLNDVVQSVIPGHTDYRLVAASRTVPDTVFLPHPDYGTLAMAHSLVEGAGSNFIQGASFQGKLAAGVTYQNTARPDIAFNIPASTVTGDFDNGVSIGNDGAYINKPDEGNTRRSGGGTGVPYFNEYWVQNAAGETFFSPNRIMPSAVMFGSLPTGVKSGTPWQTLLFRPQPSHPNSSATIPDHLLLDLFWMPVVEPYAISEPFSTAGKVNMNYQIVPYTYIERSTAVRAVLASEEILAIPATAGGDYKKSPGLTGTTWRKKIDLNATLAQWTTMFQSNKIFKSATEICDLHMVPSGSNLASLQNGTFWSANSLTGDNVRERTYANLYPRLTTKSNVFTVHYRVQALKQVNKGDNSSTNWFTWDETKDKVVSEQRGSVTIERFIDPNDPNIPDFATDASAKIDDYYQFRVLDHKRFAP